MTAPYIDLTRRGTPRRNKPYQRVTRQAREQMIRQLLLEGVTDPKEMGKRLGVTKALILHFVKRMPDIRLDQHYKPAPKTRRRIRLGWAA